jgi:membrane protein implicated in regulation of membrane protease activity
VEVLLAVVVAAALVAVGAAAVVLGEADDSPGLQGLGFLLVAGAVALGVRTVRRRRREHPRR